MRRLRFTPEGLRLQRFLHEREQDQGGDDLAAASREHRPVDLPAGTEINGGGARFSPAGNPDAGQDLRTAAVVGQWQAVSQMKVVYPAPFAESAPRRELSATGPART